MKLINNRRQKRQKEKSMGDEKSGYVPPMSGNELAGGKIEEIQTSEKGKAILESDEWARLDQEFLDQHANDPGMWVEAYDKANGRFEKVDISDDVLEKLCLHVNGDISHIGSCLHRNKLFSSDNNQQAKALNDSGKLNEIQDELVKRGWLDYEVDPKDESISYFKLGPNFPK